MVARVLRSNNERLITMAPDGAAVATADTFRRFWRSATGWRNRRDLRAMARVAGPGHPVAALILQGDWAAMDALCDELYGPLDGGQGAA